jgi:hypothetical protein
MRNDAGAMCCLGFLAKACGYANKELLGLSTPDRVVECGDGKDLFPKTSKGKSREWTHFMDINDGTDPPSERETKLKKLFKKIGVNVTFVD